MIVEIDLPRGWKNLQMPRALHRRLQELLNRQDLKGGLSPKDRSEAQALVDLAETLSLLNLRAKAHRGRASK